MENVSALGVSTCTNLPLFQLWAEFRTFDPLDSLVCGKTGLPYNPSDKLRSLDLSTLNLSTFAVSFIEMMALSDPVRVFIK